MNDKPQRYAIVGAQHRKGMQALLDSLPPDEPLTLVRENHPKDANAVQVWARGQHIGYVPRTQNKVLAQFIDAHGTNRPLPDVVFAGLAIAQDQSVPTAMSVDARLHLGSNHFPLLEIV